jgi:hypothetical protein
VGVTPAQPGNSQTMSRRPSQNIKRGAIQAPRSPRPPRLPVFAAAFPFRIGICRCLAAVDHSVPSVFLRSSRCVARIFLDSGVKFASGGTCCLALPSFPLPPSRDHGLNSTAVVLRTGFLPCASNQPVRRPGSTFRCRHREEARSFDGRPGSGILRASLLTSQSTLSLRSRKVRRVDLDALHFPACQPAYGV